MIAAFWSNVGRKSGVTTNLACIGACYALRYEKKVMVFENHLSTPSAGLKDAFLPKREAWGMVREEPYYYDCRGIGQMMKLLRAGYEPEFMDDVAVPLLDGCLNYLPLSEHMCTALYEYELNRVIGTLLRELELRSDLVLVDTQSSGNLTTKVILERCDVVVVNLIQDPQAVSDFFDRYGELADKALFLLGRYEEESIYSRINLSRMYNIPEERLVTIPEYPLLSFLCTQGRVPEFFRRHLWASPGERNFTLIHDVREAAGRLHGLTERRKTVGTGKTG